MTPLKGFTFVYHDIFLNAGKDPEIWYEFMEWADNPYLSQEEIFSLQASLDDVSLQARRYGRFAAAEGLVYPEFDENVHVIEPFPIPAEWQDNISIDPGLNNPLSAHWYAVDGDDNVYVVFEHFAAGRDVDYHAAEIHRISKMLGWKHDGKGRVSALIDSAARQRTLSGVKSVCELFYERGILVNPDVEKDLFSGIARVKGYLKQDNGLPNLYIFSNCTELIKELKGYYWGKGDVPKKVDDHALDEMRYYLMSKPKRLPVLPEKSALQVDKEKRIRAAINAKRRGGLG